MLFQWFAEQSEAVKLAIIGAFSAVGAGLFGLIKEWRKPVLDSKPQPIAVRPQDDDPMMMLVKGVEAINFGIAELKVAIKEGHASNDRLLDRVDELTKELRDVREELHVAREVLAARPRL